MNKKTMRRFICLVSFTAIIIGCVVKNAHAQPSGKASAQIGIVNHTGNYIYSASVDSAGAGNMARWGVGGADICCALIPQVWYPGMKVLVRWDMPQGHEHIWKEKFVEVERYDKPGSIYMHFFPGDEIRVVISQVGPGNPAYPIHHNGKPNQNPASN